MHWGGKGGCQGLVRFERGRLLGYFNINNMNMKRHILIGLFKFMQEKSGIIRFGRGRFRVSLFPIYVDWEMPCRVKVVTFFFWVLLQFESFHARKYIYYALFLLVIHSEGKTLGKLPNLTLQEQEPNLKPLIFTFQTRYPHNIVIN
jgi:hypothetical protein